MTNRRVFCFISVAATILVVVGLLKLTTVPVAGQAAQTTSAALKTAWGDPDLQGIWNQVFNTPLQRPDRFADREFFTDAERAEFDRKRETLLRRDKRAEAGTEKDVAGAYNSVFTSPRHAGRRTSLIVDPPNGKIPAQTPEAQQRAKAEREYALALLQATDTCKNKDRGNACADWAYGPPSPKWNEVTPFYNTGRLNRHANVEDGSLGDRCMSGNYPDLGGFRRIVQTPGGITMFIDTQQGQGFQHNIVMNGTPHLPQSIRQWWGDSRGHWEGNTLVVDVTNFSPKTSFMGSRENLHLVERWTRTDANTLEYAVTIEDPTVWTRPWTVKVELTKQNEQANRFYTEPRCVEGNYGLPALLLGERLVEVAHAEGRGPHPATKDNTTCDSGDSGEDPLGGLF
jgi:hypothetical protein